MRRRNEAGDGFEENHECGAAFELGILMVYNDRYRSETQMCRHFFRALSSALDLLCARQKMAVYGNPPKFWALLD